MATTTTRLALTKPAGTDVVDIDVLNANADKIDAAVGAYICTSTTRPSTPYAGQVIYETDSKLTWTYASGAWKLDTGIQPVVASAAARNAIFPSPVVGDSVWRSDLGYVETYYAAAGSPARAAGWYSGQDGGLVPITPASVAVGSGSATVSGNGLITFTGANQLTLNGIFSTTFRNYRVILTPTATTGSSSMDYNMRFTVGGVHNTTTNYFYGGYSANQTTVSALPGYSQTLVKIGPAHPGSSDAWMTSSTVDIYHPMDSSIGTTGFVDAFGWDGPPLRKYNLGFVQNQKISFDGVTIWADGNPNVSGTIQVYGYRN